MKDAHARSRDIAVVGLACRLPGADNPAEFWRLLTSGDTAIGPAPRSRPIGDPSGRAGLLSTVDEFDAGFFGISPRTAVRMDPQQRLVLELGWEALEDAGVTDAVLRERQAGVFLGAMTEDYAELVRAQGNPDGETLTGGQRGMITSRLSHHLGLRGPSLTVDTGQSSSLTSVHLACASLRTGECDIALAGGVNLLLSAARGRATAAFGALSPDGSSHPFGADANGFVRGEGAGLVVLKPLAVALDDGDRVYCVIRGCAVNHDGSGGDFTAPVRAAQERLLRSAYQDAETDPAEVDYVEAHGTGTRLGDPVEATALGTVLGSVRGTAGPLRIGSVKSSIGHLEAASGIAGLLKAVLAVHHRQLPATIGHTEPNPDIPFELLGLRVQTEDEPWPDGTLVAGVSSFGMGGANCHVVLASAPAPRPAEIVPSGASAPWLLSARTAQALRHQTRALRERLRGTTSWRVEDVAHSLARTRTFFECRAAVVAVEPEEFLTALGGLADGEVRIGVGADELQVAWARRWVRNEVSEPGAHVPMGRRVELPTYAFQRSRYWIADWPTDRPRTAVSAERLTLVRELVASVLEYADADAVDPDRTFADLGLESLAGVELTMGLESAVGATLPSSLVYDHPTPRAVAEFLDRVGVEEIPETTGRLAPAPHEPIAIVGIGCRFPGWIGSPVNLWSLLDAERDVLSDVPPGRGWDPAWSGHGGFLGDAAGFDNDFFGISPREALAMDPQQRVALEVVWEALEHAGVDPLSLNGSPTGVFAGVIPQQYDSSVQQSGEDLDGYVYTGTTPSVLAGRVAYSLGLSGPALAVDTACSSSLVALHLACRSLRQGETTMALAGGVTVMATPTMFAEFTRQGALSADGRSKAFSDSADGTGWSEGAGFVVLERLSDARHRGHRVLALIRGSATNSDGASNGLTAPHGPAQRLVIRQALADAGLAPSEVDAVEAHGPGTRLGDPIEANALLGTYGDGRDPAVPLWLGSVKSNLGHTQAAAGVAGVIKMVLALRNAVLPRSLHITRPTTRVDWSAGTVRPLTEARPWPSAGRPRRAGVSAFGAGGTNAHLILEEAPATSESSTVDTPISWPLSAKTGPALAEAARRLHAYLSAHSDTRITTVAGTLALRPRFAHRAAVTGSTLPELLAGLADLEGAAPEEQSGAVFVFPGQGSQWAGMARGLLDVDDAFTRTAEQCATAFGHYLDWSVLDVLRGAEGAPRMKQVDVVQPVLFTTMVSLAAWWRRRGVEPTAVVGHSQGEIAAAFVAGALSLADAARIIALRSRALLPLDGLGAMAAVSRPPAQVRDLLAPWRGRLDVAAVNGPATTTVGGEPAALAELLTDLTERGVQFRRLPVSNAGHSAQVDPLREHLLDVLAPVRPRTAEIPFYSTVTGARIDPLELDAVYWWRNAREPVLFEPATRALLADGHRVFIECNPHPLLQAALAETITDVGVPASAFGTLRREEDPSRRLPISLADAWVRGLPVDWSVDAPRPAQPADLPTYPFQHASYWVRPTPRPVASEVALPHTGGRMFLHQLSTRTWPWLADHALLGTVLVPGTGVLELVRAAGARVGAPRVEELVLETPMVLPDAGLEARTVLEPAGSGAYAVSVYARLMDEEWTLHARGRVVTATTEPVSIPWPPADAEVIDLTEAYRTLRVRGYEYGPAFQGLRQVWRRGDEIFAEVRLPDGGAGEFGLHPALLDAVLHAALLKSGPDLRIPFSWHGFGLRTTGADLLRARLRPSGTDTFTVSATDGAGTPVFSDATLRFRPRPTGLTTLAWTPSDVAAELADPVLLGPPHPGLPGVPAQQNLSGEPELVVVHLGREQSLRRTLREQVSLLNRLLMLPRAHLTLLTQDATTADPDPVAAAVRALWRSAAAENAGRVTLLDLDDSPASQAALPRFAGTRAADVALRDGVPHIPELRPLPEASGLVPPAGTWRLASGTTPEDLTPVPAPEHDRPLRPDEVRVTVRAAGLNFVDVLTSMGMFPGTAGIGREFAGVVTEVGSGVDTVAVGERVFGIVALTDSAVSPVVVTDHRLVARFPDDWSFAQAAGAPIAFLTAWLGLVGVADVRPGQDLLLHSATGGVGMAALQLADRFGLRVSATAHPTKWPVLTDLGVPPERIASSRTLDFEQRFTEGFDVVLNSLANEFVDASLRLVRPGGHFLEMGKLDIRPHDEVARAHPGVRYAPFDVLGVDPGKIAAMLAELTPLFDTGELTPLPVRTWDVTRAREAFRVFRDARHTGKLVLTFPAPLDLEGTVLITGGTGTLGATLARHLATRHGVRHLVLTSRSGLAAPGATQLRDELCATVTAHDLSDPAQVADLLASIPADRPLTAIVHAAGSMRDAVLPGLTDEHLDQVLKSKVDSVVHLHEQTRHCDGLRTVYFSSVAGTLPSPSQGNYAAANAFLDALARARDRRGQVTRSIAWGLWEQRSAMSAHLRDRDLARMAVNGLAPLSTADGLVMFDAALAGTEPVVVGARLTSTPRPEPEQPRTAESGPVDQWRALPEAERDRALREWVGEAVRAVLRLPRATDVPVDRALRELGFDSLTSVELRNRLTGATGLRLPVTVVFDHPTVTELAAFLGTELFGTPELADTALAELGAEELLALIDSELGTGEQ